MAVLAVKRKRKKREGDITDYLWTNLPTVGYVPMGHVYRPHCLPWFNSRRCTNSKLKGIHEMVKIQIGNQREDFTDRDDWLGL